MKITDIKTTLAAAKTNRPMGCSYGITHHALGVIVEVITDEGIVGIGESVGPSLPVIQTFIEKEFKHCLIGQDPLRIELLSCKMDNMVHWDKIAACAASGIEMALWDIKGKVLNTPVANLIGGYYRREVECTGYIWMDETGVNVKQAVEHVRTRGMKELKIKVGHDIKKDEERLKAIREAVGNDIKIRIDANQAWSVRTAIKFINRLQKYDLQFVEQPVPYQDFDGMAEVQRAVDVPIAADESCMTPLDAIKLIEKRACEVFIVYSSEAGGISRAKQIVNIAETCGVSCVIGTWIELGVASSANLHIVASSSNFPFANDTPFWILGDDVIKERFTVKDGKVKVPTGPGLGVNLDKQKLKKHAEFAKKATITPFTEADKDWVPKYGEIM